MAPPDLAQEVQDRWSALQRGDPATVHQVRKLTRRAQAQFRVSDASGKAGHAWKRLRTALGTVRDLDVAHEHLLRRLHGWKVPAADLRAFEEAWAADRQRAMGHLRHLYPPPAIKLKRHWKRNARKKVRRDWKSLHPEAERALTSGKAVTWHAWRKHLKRYRYTLALTGAVPEPLRELLDTLGRLQDAQVLLDLLEKHDWLPAYRDRLRQAEAETVAASRLEVKASWDALQAARSGTRPGGA